MIQTVLGNKGSGKTKRLIDMANDALKVEHGHIIFMDDDTRYMYDLRHEIRFVNTGEYGAKGADMLYGMLCGMLAVLFSLLFVAGYFGLFYACVLHIFDFFDRQRAQPITIMAAGAGWRMLLHAWFVILLAWVPYWLLCFPGSISYDSGTQLLQYLGLLPMSGDNPVFQTWLFGSFAQLGNAVFGSYSAGVFLYTCGRMLLFSFILSCCVLMMGRLGLARHFRLAATALFALTPHFPSYAITIGKDTNFAFWTLALILLVVEFIRAPKAALARSAHIAALSITLLMLCLLRNAGVYMVLGLTPFLLTVTRNRMRTCAAILIGVCALAFGFSQVLVSRLNILPEMKSANLSVVLQQTARFVRDHGAEIGPEERTAIDGVLVYDQLVSKYNPELSDPVKRLYREDASPDAVRAYLSVWRAQFKRHPLTYIQATLANSIGYLNPNAISSVKRLINFGLPSNLVDNLEYAEILQLREPRAANMLTLLVQGFQTMPGLSMLLSVGFYSWVLILCIAYALSRRQFTHLAAFAPLVFVLLGCMASPVNANFRYALPIIISAPLCVALCMRREGAPANS